jgi:hypothetical protein
MEENVPAGKKGQFGHGDICAWVTLYADTELVPCFMAGDRELPSARLFIDDLESRIANGVQPMADGPGTYLGAVEAALGSDVDCAHVIKIQRATQEETRYGSAE